MLLYSEIYNYLRTIVAQTNSLSYSTVQSVGLGPTYQKCAYIFVFHYKQFTIRDRFANCYTDTTFYFCNRFVIVNFRIN